MLISVCQETSRSLSQHRPSFSSGPSSLPRQSYSRSSNTYSSSLGALNPAHRVTRRKSSNLPSPAAINAAVNAVENGEDDANKGMNRRSIQSRMALGSLNAGSYPSPPNSLPQTGMLGGKGAYTPSNGSALVDGPSLASMSDKIGAKGRIRRASDGSTLSSSKKKGGNGDLKCETCGKAYKHSSCLTKHLLVSPMPLETCLFCSTADVTL